MIEVNLLPSGRKRKGRKGRSPSVSLPEMKGFGGDRWLLAVLLVAVLTLGAAGWLWLGLASDRRAVEEGLAQAVQDSARYADLIAQTTELESRRDSILERVSVIEEIDRDRMVWPHILDEVARALPDYTWLQEITTISSTPVVFQLNGRAGNTRAITLFMEQLQSSPFFRSVRLITSQAVVENQNSPQQQVVQSFELEVTYEAVPLEELETVPLFADDGVGGQESMDAGDAPGVGTPAGTGVGEEGGDEPWR
jgi:type IV pilus assembly protein PilN